MVEDAQHWTSSLCAVTRFHLKLLYLEILGSGVAREFVDLEISGEKSPTTRDVIRRCPQVLGVRLSPADSGRLIGMVNSRASPVHHASSNSGCMLSEAQSYGGHLKWTWIAPGVGSIRELVCLLRRSGCEASVDHVRLLRTGLQLTPKQRDVLAAAMSRGFYDIPRRARLEDLGRDFGVTRQTVNEVLRRAEKKVLGQLL